MKILKYILALSLIITATAGFNPAPPRILHYIADPQKQDLRFYWKNDSGQVLRSIQNLKSFLEHKNKKLVFAMNGGMYTNDNAPLGLYVENSKTISRLNTRSGSGNFYLKPNGVFYITQDNRPGICQTAEYGKKKQVKFATQSGPLLLIDGKIHSSFKEGSLNLNIRNGVGILPGNKTLFAMSVWPVNFYDFAEFFKSQGCKDALYLDGSISQTYLPEKDWTQTGGNFGVMIGVSSRK